MLSLGKKFIDDTVNPLWQAPTVFPGYDPQHREVIIQAVRTDSTELSVLRLLSSLELRSKPTNHTIPILDMVSADVWTLVIMPA